MSTPAKPPYHRSAWSPLRPARSHINWNTERDRDDALRTDRLSLDGLAGQVGHSFIEADDVSVLGVDVEEAGSVGERCSVAHRLLDHDRVETIGACVDD